MRHPRPPKPEPPGRWRSEGAERRVSRGPGCGVPPSGGRGVRSEAAGFSWLIVVRERSAEGCLDSVPSVLGKGENTRVTTADAEQTTVAAFRPSRGL